MVDVDAADAPSWRDVSDIPEARVSEVREWYRMYKTAEGKGENKYGLGGPCRLPKDGRAPPGHRAARSRPPPPAAAGRLVSRRLRLAQAAPSTPSMRSGWRKGRTSTGRT